jgi:hypothetical protein
MKAPPCISELLRIAEPQLQSKTMDRLRYRRGPARRVDISRIRQPGHSRCHRGRNRKNSRIQGEPRYRQKICRSEAARQYHDMNLGQPLIPTRFLIGQLGRETAVPPSCGLRRSPRQSYSPSLQRRGPGRCGSSAQPAAAFPKAASQRWSSQCWSGDRRTGGVTRGINRFRARDGEPCSTSFA